MEFSNEFYFIKCFIHKLIIEKMYTSLHDKLPQDILIGTRLKVRFA